eukprot:5869317-Prymnesium_polylepis.1
MCIRDRVDVLPLVVRLELVELEPRQMARVAVDPVHIVTVEASILCVGVRVGVCAHRARLGVVVGGRRVQVDQVLGQILPDPQVAHRHLRSARAGAAARRADTLPNVELLALVRLRVVAAAAALAVGVGV